MDPIDWGLDLPQAHFSGVRGDRFERVDSDDPWEMPLVRTAGQHGYEPAPEALMWAFLPAVWPASARAWVSDTRIRHARHSCNGGPMQVVAWSTEDYFETEAIVNGLLAQCRLPPRPAGRVWLLKPPPGQPSLQVTLQVLAESAIADGLDLMASAEFVAHVRRRLHELFQTTSTPAAPSP